MYDPMRLSVAIALLALANPCVALASLATPVPSSIVEEATAYIVECVGEDLYRDSIRFDSSEVLLRTWQNEVGRQEGEQYTRYVCRFVFEPAGSHGGELGFAVTRVEDEEWEAHSMPDCANRPQFCIVKVAMEEAKAIARSHGLGDDDSELRAKLRIDGEYLRWDVIYRIPQATRGENRERLSR